MSSYYRDDQHKALSYSMCSCVTILLVFIKAVVSSGMHYHSLYNYNLNGEPVRFISDILQRSEPQNFSFDFFKPFHSFFCGLRKFKYDETGGKSTITFVYNQGKNLTA